MEDEETLRKFSHTRASTIEKGMRTVLSTVTRTATAATPKLSLTHVGGVIEAVGEGDLAVNVAAQEKPKRDTSEPGGRGEKKKSSGAEEQKFEEVRANCGVGVKSAGGKGGWLVQWGWLFIFGGSFYVGPTLTGAPLYLLDKS